MKKIASAFLQIATCSLREEMRTLTEQKATIEVGQWVLVEYDGDLFPGTVTQVNLISRFLLICEYFSSYIIVHAVQPKCVERDYKNVS